MGPGAHIGPEFPPGPGAPLGPGFMGPGAPLGPGFMGPGAPPGPGFPAPGFPGLGASGHAIGGPNAPASPFSKLIPVPQGIPLAGSQPAETPFREEPPTRSIFQFDDQASTANVVRLNLDGTPYEPKEDDEEPQEAQKDKTPPARSGEERAAAPQLFSEDDSPEIGQEEFKAIVNGIIQLPHEAKVQIQGPKGAEFLSRAEKSLIDDNDLKALYWLSKVEKPENLKSCPPWLAHIAYLGLTFPLLSSESAKKDLTSLITDAYYGLENLDEGQIMILAAAVIRPSVLLYSEDLPEFTGALADLLNDHPPLRDLLLSLKDLSLSTQPLLGPHTMSKAAVSNMLESRKADLDKRTDSWLETYPQKKVVYNLATVVWRLLSSDNGPVNDIIRAARKGGDPSELQKAADEIDLWRDTDYCDDQVAQLAKLTRGKETKAIAFRARDRLLELFRESMDLASEWLDLHNDVRKFGAEKNDRYQKVVDQLAKKAAKALAHLGSFRKDSQAPGAGILIPALKELSAKFERLLSETRLEIDLGAHMTEAAAKLYAWLGRIPGLKDPSPRADSTLSLPALCQGIFSKLAPLERFQGQISDHRFYMASLELALNPELAEPGAPNSWGKKEPLSESFKEQLGAEAKKRLKTLKDELSAMLSKIEGSRVWGGLEDERRDELRVKVRALERSHGALSALDKTALSEPAHAFELSELIRGLSDVDAAIGRQLAQANQRLTGRLEDLKAKAGLEGGGEIPRGAVSLIESLIEDGELLSAHDQLNQVEESLSLGLPIAAQATLASSSLASDFFGVLDELHQSRDHLHAASRLGYEPDEEGAAMFSMFASIHSGHEWDLSNLPEILSWLGFENVEGRKFSTKFLIPPFDLAAIPLEEATLNSPLPKWGSQASRFLLILAAGGNKADEIVSMLKEVLAQPGEPVFLLLRESVSKRTREKLGALLRAKSLCPVVLDLSLMAFLAGLNLDGGDRAKAFLQIGSAGGAHNPYLAEPSAPVPPEMLFGRKELLERLWDKNGPCLVHGGRQMGKTVLLETLLQTKHSPKDGVVVLKLSARGHDSLCELVMSALRKNRLLLNWQNDPAGSPAYIKTLFEKSARPLIDCHASADHHDQSLGKMERLVLLIEDSDHLLERGPSDNFEQLAEFAASMLDTGRRFKIILSGLAAVQRFQNYPDNPFSHFGAPLCVGPMSLSDAHDLVVAPMEALGFTFERGTLVHRILAMCNHHPGLIQLFCHALVEHVQNRGIWMITPDAIDEVYNQPALRAKIIERFNWTVDADPRYRVVAYAIAFQELQDEGLESSGDGGGQDLSTRQILDRVFDIWPAAFKDMDVDGLESLILEARDIGLVRSAADRHALRNPNVLSLLVGDEDPATLLDSYADRPYEPKPGPEGLRRILMSPFYPLPSPLVFSQENELRSWGSGLTLLVGSMALGLDRVRDALKTLEERDQLGIQPKIISLKYMTGDKRLKEIERIAHEDVKKQGRPVIVVVDSLSGLDESVSVSDLTDSFWRLLNKTANFLHKTGAEAKRSLKVVALAHPDAWLSRVAQPKGLADDVEIKYLERWNHNGLSQYLKNVDSPGHDANSILQATSGWYNLVWQTICRTVMPFESPMELSDAFYRLAGPMAPEPIVKSCLSILKAISELEDSKNFDSIESEVAKDLESLNLSAQARRIRPLLEALARLSIITPVNPSDGSASSENAAWALDSHYLESLMDAPGDLLN